MGKSAIALCILVVVWSAEGSFMSTLQDAVSSAVTKLTSEIQGAESLLQNNFTSTIQQQMEYALQVQTLVKNISAQWDQELKDLTADYPNTGTCISSGYNLTLTIETLKSSMISCGNSTPTELKSKYDEIVTGYKKIVNQLGNATTSAVACVTDLSTAMTCLGQIYKDKILSSVEDIQTLTAEQSELVQQISKYQTSLVECGFNTGLLALSTQAQSGFTDIEKCLKELNSSSSS